jgi:FlaA1/EpsC-like NDP-sugar epimerase
MRATWQGKQVLVTGADGFIGSKDYFTSFAIFFIQYSKSI